LLPVSPESDRYGARNRPRIAKMLEYIVTQLLFEFFYADGEGIGKEELDSSTILLRRAIGSLSCLASLLLPCLAPTHVSSLIALVHARSVVRVGDAGAQVHLPGHREEARGGADQGKI
jgi:hypothetical protein